MLKGILFKGLSFLNKIGTFAATIHDDIFWEEEGAGYLFMRDFLVGLDNALWPFLIVISTILSLYAIVLGVNMARAENPADSKKKIVATVSSLIAIIVIIILLKFVVIPNMGDIFGLITQTFG